MKLLVIDIQKGITDNRLYNFESFIDNTKRIIDAARENQMRLLSVFPTKVLEEENLKHII